MLINEIEELVMKMSIQAISINRSHGKTLRELFNMFSGKIVKAIDYEGFKEMTQFLNNNTAVEEEILKPLFVTFLQPLTKGLTLA